MLPVFDLSAHDYLGFAERELGEFQKVATSSRAPALLLNCISHLRLAMDCQLETFLYIFNLDRAFDERRLGMRQKLEFLKSAGILESRFLIKLYTMRGLMDARYAAPGIEEVAEYFALVSAFVSILQHTSLLAGACEHSIVVRDGTDKGLKRFIIEYNFDVPKIEIAWEVQDEKERFECDFSEMEEFTFCFKVIFLLYLWDEVATNKYILSQLDAQ